MKYYSKSDSIIYDNYIIIIYIMGTNRVESLCRVDDHWCTECCEGMGCELLGELSDGSWGCLGYELAPGEVRYVDSVDGLIMVTSQKTMCKRISCIQDMPQHIAVFHKIIESLEPGEFVMSNIINSIEN